MNRGAIPALWFRLRRRTTFGRYRLVAWSTTSMTNVPVAGPAVAVMVAMPGRRATRWSPSTATIEGRLLV
jgi:hypothetical protein